MSDTFCLSDVGEGIHEAEIVRWLVDVGDQVEAFQPLLEVQTDKAIVELSSPHQGKIVERCGDVGMIVHVGDMLVRYEAGTSKTQVVEVKSQSLPSGQADYDEAIANDKHGTAAFESSNGSASRVLAAPATRKYARQHGVDLTLIVGTGPKGRITRQDVQHAQTTPHVADVHAADRVLEQKILTEQQTHESPESTPDVLRVPLRGLRRAIADHMVKAAFTAPHVSAFDDCDVTELVELRKRLLVQMRKVDPQARLTYLPFFIKAVIAALKAFPECNAHMDEEKQELVIYKEPHIGVAVDTDDGLLVPVLKKPEGLTLSRMQSDLNGLIERARTRKSSANELKGSTFTITNVGAIGGTYATPILNYPEVAILGMHKMEQRAVVRDGQIVIRDMMTMSMSFDHRVIDGAKGVRFMNEVKKWIESPELLTLY